jgi:hypothetical protein
VLVFSGVVAATLMEGLTGGDASDAGVGVVALVVLAALVGDPTLSIRDDEVEESWAIVDPILDAWRAGEPPLLAYPAGSDGPDRSLLRNVRR